MSIKDRYEKDAVINRFKYGRKRKEKKSYDMQSVSRKGVCG
jgi:hypothetical protein